jgi:Bacterial Ig domain/Dockerin type I domain
MNYKSSYTSMIKILAILFVFGFPAVQAATLSLSPASQTINAGSNFTVNITLNTQSANVDGVDLRYVNFDPTDLQVEDADAIAAGIQITPGSLMPVTSVNSVDNVNGKILFLQTSSGGTTYNGQGVLATIKFRSIAAGASPVTFTFTAGNTTDTNVASDGTDVLTSATGGTYTLTDLVAPAVAITSPTSGQKVNDTITITATASDNIAVAGVQFRIDSTNIGAEDMSAPYSVAFITTTVSNATHTLYVVARDAAGNTNTSSVSIIVNNTDITPPVISQVAASSITTTSAIITWTTNELTDSQIDYGTTVSYGLSTPLDTNLVTSHSQQLTGLLLNKLYHYRVKSRDASSNIAMSTDYTFQTLDIDSVPPTVAITAPANASTVSGNITLSANANDNVAVAGVSFFIDSTSIGQEDTSAPYSLIFDTKTAANGTHRITAVARDTGNNNANASVIIIIANSYTFTAPTKIKISLEGASSFGTSGTLQIISPLSKTVIKELNIITNASGDYTLTLTGVPQNVDLKFVAAGYLARIVYGVDLNSTAAKNGIVFPVLLAGDLDGNNQVNSLDFSIMNTGWYSTSALADINKDGMVNTIDYSLLNTNWQKIGDSP